MQRPILKRKYTASYNLFLPISRIEGLREFIWNLNRVQMPRRIMNLVVYADMPDKKQELVDQIMWLNRLGMFHSSTIYISGNEPVGENILERRQRIVEIWQWAQKNLPNVNYTFCVEDDTFPSTVAFRKLSSLIRKPDIMYAQGIECHRQCNSLGAWFIRDEYAETISNNDLKEGGVIDVQGGGFYCFIVETHVLKQAKIRHAGPAFGPDVCFVYDAVRKYKDCRAVTDLSVKCGHKINGKVIYPGEVEADQLAYHLESDDINHMVKPKLR